MSSKGEDEAIRTLSRNFRSLVEGYDRASLPLDLRDFPRGACGTICLLLSKYLENHGYRGFEYVCGELGSKSHAWLEGGGLVVDITGDQFDQPPVNVTRDLTWYRGLTEVERHHSDFERYDNHTARQLGILYASIANPQSPPA